MTGLFTPYAHGPLRAFAEGAAAALLLGLVFSAAQWVLARIYGEKPG
jgi:hypothetical protein